jgi:hypothetical protein
MRNVSAKTTNRIDMSLRLWSDHVLLGAAIKQLNVAINHAHTKSQPMAKKGRLAKLTAPRHYVSAAESRGENSSDILDWCRLILGRVASQTSLVNLLHAREVEGVLWIAVIGPKQSPTPNIPSEIVAAAKQCDMGIVVENYTILKDGVPDLLWVNRPPDSSIPELR